MFFSFSFVCKIRLFEIMESFVLLYSAVESLTASTDYQNSGYWINGSLIPHPVHSIPVHTFSFFFGSSWQK